MYFKLEILKTQSGLFLLIFFSLKKKKKLACDADSHCCRTVPPSCSHNLWYRTAISINTTLNVMAQEQKAKLWGSFFGKNLTGELRT